MIEIKLLSPIAVKQTGSTNSLILLGGDLYGDVFDNRYLFVSLQNNQNYPFFGFTLKIKQFDDLGSFIKESKYFAPVVYGEKAEKYMIEKPISLEKECNAVEIEVLNVSYLPHKGEEKPIKEKVVYSSSSSKPESEVENVDTLSANNDQVEEGGEVEAKQDLSKTSRSITSSRYKTLPFLAQGIVAVLAAAIFVVLVILIAYFVQLNYYVYPEDSFFPYIFGVK